MQCTVCTLYCSGLVVHTLYCAHNVTHGSTHHYTVLEHTMESRIVNKYLSQECHHCQIFFIYLFPCCFFRLVLWIRWLQAELTSQRENKDGVCGQQAWYQWCSPKHVCCQQCGWCKFGRSDMKLSALSSLSAFLYNILIKANISHQDWNSMLYKTFIVSELLLSVIFYLAQWSLGKLWLDQWCCRVR